MGGTRGWLATAAIAALLAGCGGGGGGSSSGTAPGGTGGTSSSSGGQTGQQISEPDAVRLAKQATFGPTQAVVDAIRSQGAEAWLNSQFAASGSSYSDLATRVVPRNHCNALTGTAANDCRRDFLGPLPVAMRFYANAMGQNDQLRQRVAWALSQILVVSEVEVDSTAGLAGYQQILLDNAFGNYRDILRAITLNPYMGDYLDMVDSRRTGPNQNYARELLQLFSVYVAELNADGSKRKDAQGNDIPTYSEQDVTEIARALTGWTYARLNGAPLSDGNQVDYVRPMVPNTNNFDNGAKSFLGRQVAQGATPEQNIDAVIDAIFNHPNVGPFVGTQLIQHLVSANPSPAYVQRVTAAFNNNGSGVRGDLRAVVRAVLTDPEARGDRKSAARDGKLKEPVLLMTGLMRLIGTQTDGYVFTVRDGALGQQPFESPSVFNFYPWDYPLPGSQALVSPSTKLLSTSTVHNRHNLSYDWTISGDATRSEYAPLAGLTGATGTQVNWGPWETAAADLDALIDRLDLLMLNRTMTAAQKTALRDAMSAITNTDPAVQARRRVQTAMYIIASSALFQVDK
jgi:uncharacterized protein (DUF1800 family)